jgi:hypothetical protein
MARKMVLDVAEMNRAKACSNSGCLEQLLGGITTFAASTLVSGSIVVAGNFIYWMEQRANCNPHRASPQAPPASAGI